MYYFHFTEEEPELGKNSVVGYGPRQVVDSDLGLSDCHVDCAQGQEIGARWHLGITHLANVTPLAKCMYALSPKSAATMGA